MRNSFRYLMIALPTALYLFLWVAVPALSRAKGDADPRNDEAIVKLVLAQETQAVNDSPGPTRVPRPTPTPIPVPPPTSQNTIQLLVVSGVLVVAVVIFGIWLNRNRVF